MDNVNVFMDDTRTPKAKTTTTSTWTSSLSAKLKVSVVSFGVGKMLPFPYM